VLRCEFCGFEDELAGVDVLGGYLVDWTSCCLAMREYVERFGFEAAFGRKLEDVVSEITGLEVREVVLEGDRGDSVARCRLAGIDPGLGVSGGRTEVFEDVERYHRHHGPPVSWKFGVAVHNGRTRVGVAVVGRPVSRVLQGKEPRTLEITRLCTWGESSLRRNAATKLLGLAARRARKLGCDKLITYTLAEEDGASLRAAGFEPVAEVKGRSWDRPGRRRTDKAPTTNKVRWERTIGRSR